MKRLSMRVRIAFVFATLIAAVALFMIQFFPAQMAEQAQISTERRARTVTRVMATAVAPALEFDDADYAAKILGWLASTPDARFAVVITENGKRFAAWSAERVPATLPTAPTAIIGNTLVTSAPVVGRVGGGGTLYLGQSLDRLVADRAAARRTVVTASLIVLAIALCACLVIATTLVRPFERLTTIAHDIARGTKPPRIETVKGGREVVQMTNALGTMLDRLNAANSQLVEASRHAGMAEVATGVLHNVGNVLTSVNVGIETLAERIGTIPADRIERAGDLLNKVCDAPQIDRDKVQAGVKYLAAISSHLVAERTAMLAEIATLRNHVGHVSRVIAQQNSYAKRGGVDEQVTLGKLVDEAIALGCPEHKRHGVQIVRRVDDDEVTTDRHRVLQIAVNLIANARDSVTSHAGGTQRVTVTCGVIDGMLELRVEDTGAGIAGDSLLRIFNAGFTTKPKGHGYGLHSSALAAEQLGGTLRCASEGPGHGATFVLRIPVKREQS